MTLSLVTYIPDASKALPVVIALEFVNLFTHVAVLLT